MGLIITVTTLLSITLASCASANHAPVINALTADKDELCIKSSSELNANATDPDEDELTYTWVVPSGIIKGEGSSVSWKAPSTPGTHIITLVVTDGRGGETTRMLTLNVIPNSSPIIERLSSKLVVCRDIESTPVECVASDPDGDELSYRWTTSGGEISGQGPVISWILPAKNGLYTVAVAITDGKGCEATREKTIRVT